MHAPEYEIIYCRNRIGYREIQKARKELPREKRYAAVALSIFLASILYFLEYFYFHSSMGLSSILSLIIAYALIFAFRIGICIPKEWAIGINGIYLPYITKRLIEWNEITKVERKKDGVILHTRSRMCGIVYLIGNVCIEKIVANAYISASF